MNTPDPIVKKLRAKIALINKISYNLLISDKLDTVKSSLSKRVEIVSA